jgi:pimeloyl-ACP methyl ester carboxylesterase
MMADGIQRPDVGRGIELAYERLGDASDPPLLLVMGLATQMLGWPDEFCAQLAGRGLFVAPFDNRDVGLSTHLHHAVAASPAGAGDPRPRRPAGATERRPGHGRGHPGPELVEHDGMGHDVPRALWPDLIERIAGIVKRAEGERPATRSAPARGS